MIIRAMILPRHVGLSQDAFGRGVKLGLGLYHFAADYPFCAAKFPDLVTDKPRIGIVQLLRVIKFPRAYLYQIPGFPRPVAPGYYSTAEIATWQDTLQ